jgi:MSHA pilin protein MshC
MRLVGGFTLVELVVTLMLLSIVALLVLPRFEVSPFKQHAYSERLRADLRLLRQMAVARNESLTLEITPQGHRACSGSVCPPAGPFLLHPVAGRAWDGQTLASGLAPAGAGAASSASVTFDSRGSTATGLDIAVGTARIVVMAGSGHVE